MSVVYWGWGTKFWCSCQVLVYVVAFWWLNEPAEAQVGGPGFSEVAVLARISVQLDCVVEEVPCTQGCVAQSVYMVNFAHL